MVNSEPTQGIMTRRWILLSYLAVVILLGIPMWLHTTSIYRAPLNYEEMDFYDKSMADLIDINIPVYLNVESQFPDLALATQLLIDKELKENGVHGWRLKIVPGEGSSKDYNIGFRLGEQDSYVISDISREIMITYTLQSVSIGQIPQYVVAVLMDHIFKDEIEMYKHKEEQRDDTKVLQYSPKYHLTFSLFYGGGDAISWEMTEALQEYFSPLQDCLESTFNLTIDTQIQFYSEIGSIPSKDKDNQNHTVWSLEKDDLSTFINFAEWSLTSIHSYPTLHFILYVPDKLHTPLIIKDSSTNSFTVPQWGGVIIDNILPVSDQPKHITQKELEPVLETFSFQFLNLIGIPSNPNSLFIRLDILSRISAVRTLMATASALGSLRRLSQSLPDIAIPQPVLISVQDSMVLLKRSLEALHNGDWSTSIVSAGESLEKAQKAFFDKMMVQQVFFPEEHKIAIYMPLLGPIGIVMGMGLVREIKAWKGSKKNKKE